MDARSRRAQQQQGRAGPHAGGDADPLQRTGRGAADHLDRHRAEFEQLAGERVLDRAHQRALARRGDDDAVAAQPQRRVGDALGLVADLVHLTNAAERRLENAGIAASYRAVRHWPAVLAGSLMSSYIALLFWLAGYKYADASIAAVINELAAVFIVALAAWLLRERVTARQLGGGALALAGVLVVVLAA